MTFSLVARCPRTAELGIAAVTAVPAVGKLLTWARPGRGAVATQAWINPYLGYDALELLGQEYTAESALTRVLAQDPDHAIRQLAIVDAQGNVAARTGAQCSQWAGHLTGQGCSAQGNLLVGPEPLHAMVEVFNRNPDDILAHRLLCAIEAGQATGGDVRGASSATVYVIAGEEYPLWDMRVDDHADPLGELRRLYDVFRKDVVPHIQRLPRRDDPHGEPEGQAIA